MSVLMVFLKGGNNKYLIIVFLNSLFMIFLGHHVWPLGFIVLINSIFLYFNYKDIKFINFTIFIQTIFIFLTILEISTKRLSGWYFHQVPLEIINLIMDTNLGEMKSSLFFSYKEILGFALIIVNIVVYISILRKGIVKNRKKDLLSWFFLIVVGVSFSKNPISSSIKEIYEKKDIVQKNAKSIQLRKSFSWKAKELNIEDQQTVVIFLGETHRGDFLSLNGYKKETPPRLNSEDIVSFSNAISQAPSTLLSTPMILSRKNVMDTDIFTETSLISAYKKAGFETWYVSYLAPAHIGDNEINLIVNEADHYIQSDVNESTLNEILTNKSRKKLIVYKTVGSHYLFHERYPKESNKFKPSFTEASYAVPSVKDKEKLENTYANSILYSVDEQVSQFISNLKHQEGMVSLSFISDHGVAIYDDGKSLYGGVTPGNYSIGLFFWFNDEFKNKYNYFIVELDNNRNLPVTSECFVDTMLDIGHIESLRKGCSLFDKNTFPKNRLVKDMQLNVFDFDEKF